MWKIIALAFFAACVYLWFPAERYLSLASNDLVSPVPAGEITSGFRLHQEIGIKNLPVSSGRNTGRAMCIGLRFATFKRTNQGRLDVEVRQRDFAKRWSVSSESLADNELRFFCPKWALDPSLPFSVDVRGVDGVLGSSPTLWLTNDTIFGVAKVNGIRSDKSVNVELARKVRVGYKRLIALDDGAFLLGWLCTLFIGFSAIYLLRTEAVGVSST